MMKFSILSGKPGSKPGIGAGIIITFDHTALRTTAPPPNWLVLSAMRIVSLRFTILIADRETKMEQI